MPRFASYGVFLLSLIAAGIIGACSDQTKPSNNSHPALPDAQAGTTSPPQATEGPAPEWNEGLRALAAALPKSTRVGEPALGVWRDHSFFQKGDGIVTVQAHYESDKVLVVRDIDPNTHKPIHDTTRHDQRADIYLITAGDRTQETLDILSAAREGAGWVRQSNIEPPIGSEPILRWTRERETLYVNRFQNLLVCAIEIDDASSGSGRGTNFGAQQIFIFETNFAKPR